ncbi:Mitochondrial import inner membrane translocase subunit TIM50 [Choanephora cucurbitarum]|uniref:Mitochondrial import inner membrane translocase subunit TIM50 n=1 Tax=Choanephora cucurbitarum TaxID=101091 RepID=A0A1C7NEU3_9FUNG|nr:Mitochondrial import inner membrane translocase subunit TIM50 [Choanephora cucurbitarum]
MFRRSILQLQRSANTVVRRSYSTTPESTPATSRLAEEALAQKTSGQSRATLPKGDKKPTKVKSDKDNQYANALYAGAAVGLGVGGLFYFGRPFEDGREDKYVEENAFVAAYKRCVDRLNEFQKNMNDPIWDKLLPDPLPYPYNRPYTLVINLDETLVYSYWDKDHGWRHAKRPGVDYFLTYLSQFFEIVIFTSQPSMNAVDIIDKLDRYQSAVYRLYREATRYVDGKHVKDLSHLNRDLSKVIIMDSNPESFSLQPENGIALKPWKGEPGDKGLLEYIPFFEALIYSSPSDVRDVIASFEGKHIPTEWARRESIMEEERIKQWEREHSQKPSRNLGSLFGGGAVQSQGPPPSPREVFRQQCREAYVAQFEEQKKFFEQAEAENMERQAQMMKEMKMSVWDLMAQVASGQPMEVPPPSIEGQSQQPQQQQPQQ